MINQHSMEAVHPVCCVLFHHIKDIHKTITETNAACESLS